MTIVRWFRSLMFVAILGALPSASFAQFSIGIGISITIEPPALPVSKPVQRQVTDYVDFTGRTDAVEAVDVRPRVTGYLVSMPFKEGSEVRGDSRPRGAMGVVASDASHFAFLKAFALTQVLNLISGLIVLGVLARYRAIVFLQRLAGDVGKSRRQRFANPAVALRANFNLPFARQFRGIHNGRLVRRA